MFIILFPLNGDVCGSLAAARVFTTRLTPRNPTLTAAFYFRCCYIKGVTYKNIDFLHHLTLKTPVKIGDIGNIQALCSVEELPSLRSSRWPCCCVLSNPVNLSVLRQNLCCTFQGITAPNAKIRGFFCRASLMRKAASPKKQRPMIF